MSVEITRITGTRVTIILCMAKPFFCHCFIRNCGHVTSDKLILFITDYTQKELNTYQPFASTLFILFLTITITVDFAQNNTSS